MPRSPRPRPRPPAGGRCRSRSGRRSCTASPTSSSSTTTRRLRSTPATTALRSARCDPACTPPAGSATTPAGSTSSTARSCRSPADGLDYVLPEPYGVIGAIVPWNGPMMGMGQKVAPALAAGNTVVAKPPEIAPFGALRFAELALEAGLPPGVLNVVTGGADAGQALVRDPRRRQGVVHRRQVDRPRGDDRRRRDPQAAGAGARRQVGQHRLRRRRPRCRRQPRRAVRRRLAVRSGLRAADPALRAGRRLRRGGRAADRSGREPRRRRSVGSDDVHGPGRARARRASASWARSSGPRARGPAGC